MEFSELFLNFLSFSFLTSMCTHNIFSNIYQRFLRQISAQYAINCIIIIHLTSAGTISFMFLYRTIHKIVFTVPILYDIFLHFIHITFLIDKLSIIVIQIILYILWILPYQFSLRSILFPNETKNPSNIMILNSHIICTCC